MLGIILEFILNQNIMRENFSFSQNWREIMNLQQEILAESLAY